MTSTLRILAIACVGIATTWAQQPAFQDQVRKEPKQPQQRRAGAGFQDSAWQASRSLEQGAETRSMYQEPFTISSDDEIHSMVDLAYARMLAKLKEEDKEHDGLLRTQNIADLLTYVMNPDGAPLSSSEEALLRQGIEDYMRRQGFSVPGREVRMPVKQDFLHSWSTLFFLRDLAPALRNHRAQVKAEREAAEQQALRDSMKPVEVSNLPPSQPTASASGGLGVQQQGTVAADGAYVVSGTVVDFGGDAGGNAPVDPLLSLLAVEGDDAAATVLSTATR